MFSTWSDATAGRSGMSKAPQHRYQADAGYPYEGQRKHYRPEYTWKRETVRKSADNFLYAYTNRL